MFIPIVRLILVRTDFQQNLVYDYNVTTQMMTSWSLLASGLGAPFALVASFSMIVTKGFKKSKAIYAQLKTKLNHVPSRDLSMATTNGGKRTHNDVNYQNVNQQ